ncbi:hypothetical protein HPB47_009746 [Ixodes persulcatus]|uniref:Uncharacterized protein n=1 Tax=Ixodes persulcatus TaxID=34615 RepID=A0AC60P119_IXOPE|nr:hypothetical protein HPB47_009746 [Ixodes persulcatus]
MRLEHRDPTMLVGPEAHARSLRGAAVLGRLPSLDDARTTRSRTARGADGRTRAPDVTLAPPLTRSLRRKPADRARPRGPEGELDQLDTRRLSLARASGRSRSAVQIAADPSRMPPRMVTVRPRRRCPCHGLVWGHSSSGNSFPSPGAIARQSELSRTAPEPCGEGVVQGPRVISIQRSKTTGLSPVRGFVLRAQAQVLKKAVSEEQSRNAELKDALKDKEQGVRKLEQEVESLNFCNQQLTKRVGFLQEELEGDRSKKDKKKKAAAPSPVHQGVIDAELQSRIEENEKLHLQVSGGFTPVLVSSAEFEHRRTVERLEEELEQARRAVNAREGQLSQTLSLQEETISRLTQERARLELKLKSCEKELKDVSLRNEMSEAELRDVKQNLGTRLRAATRTIEQTGSLQGLGAPVLGKKRTQRGSSGHTLAKNGVHIMCFKTSHDDQDDIEDEKQLTGIMLSGLEAHNVNAELAEYASLDDNVCVCRDGRACGLDVPVTTGAQESGVRALLCQLAELLPEAGQALSSLHTYSEQRVRLLLATTSGPQGPLLRRHGDRSGGRCSDSLGGVGRTVHVVSLQCHGSSSPVSRSFWNVDEGGRSTRREETSRSLVVRVDDD